jgi:hypothetical protein
MIVVFLVCGCAAGTRVGEKKPEARLLEAQADFDEATKLKGASPEMRVRDLRDFHTAWTAGGQS